MTFTSDSEMGGRGQAFDTVMKLLPETPTSHVGMLGSRVSYAYLAMYLVPMVLTLFVTRGVEVYEGVPCHGSSLPPKEMIINCITILVIPDTYINNQMILVFINGSRRGFFCIFYAHLCLSEFL